MKTFQQFLQLAERYYKPDEKLPSGKTPYEKASASYEKQDKEYYSKPLIVTGKQIARAHV